MKLISNKSTGSLFRKVAEINEGKANWSAEYPNVCHGSSPFFIPGTDIMNGRREWFFAFKAVGGRNCVMSVDVNGIIDKGFAFRVELYDNSMFGKDSFGDFTGFVQDGIIGAVRTYNSNSGRYETHYHSMTVDTSHTMVFIARVSIWTINSELQYVSNQPIIIVFSDTDNPSTAPIVDFDTSSHFVLDYAGAIDASCWNVNGKIYRHRSLYEMGRRHFPYSNLPKALRAGATYKTVDIPVVRIPDEIGRQSLLESYGESKMKDEFALMENENGISTGIVTNFSTSLVPFPMNHVTHVQEQRHRGVLFDAFIHLDSSERMDFRISTTRTAEVFLQIGDGFTRHYDFSEFGNSASYLHPEMIDGTTAMVSNVNLMAGWTRITLQCRCPKCINYDGVQTQNTDYVSCELLAKTSNGSTFLPLNEIMTLFVPNDTDIDRTMTVNDVFSGVDVVRMNESPKEFYDDGVSSLLSFNEGFLANGFTFGMDFRMPFSQEQVDGNLFPRNIVTSNLMRITQVSVDEMKLEIIEFEDNGGEQVADVLFSKVLKYKPDTWQSLFITLEGKTAGWNLFDSEDNGIAEISVKRVELQQCTQFQLGYGSVESSHGLHYGLANVFVANKILTFREMHEVFMHRSC